MANIGVRRVPQARAEREFGLERGRELQPFVSPHRVMRSLLSWDPFRDLRDVGPRADGTRALSPWASIGVALEEERSFASPLGPRGPAFDVKETKDAYVLYADLPGFKEADVQVQVHGQKLTIAGKRVAEEHKEGEKYFFYERRHGSFTRAFTLPEAADASKVTADLKDGVLTLSVAKKLSEQPRTVSINSAR